jgi:Ser-tRNA(Ala) deacylase AlaX
MRTKQIYLEDSYQKEMKATILEVDEEGEGRYKIILDQTVFYPMGGGQATDQGVLKLRSTEAQVYQVVYKDGEIWHFAKSQIMPKIGEKVHGEINWDRRYKNMKLHSGGHIVDFAMHLLGYSPKSLVPQKADHDKNPHIIYQGSIDHDVKEELQEKINELIKKDLEFSWYFQPLEDLQKEAIYLQPGLPTTKPLRTLKLQDVGAVADGGTQIKRTSEVGSVTITDIEIRDDNTIVKYSVSSI